MLAASRSLLDRRVLAALELVDAATGERITAPMALASPSLGFVRNRSGLFVINAMTPRTAQERQLAAHLAAFDEAPAGLATGAMGFPVTVTDPAARYVPRIVSIALPRGAAAGEPVKVAMFAGPAAPVGQNWSGVRASLKRRSSGQEVPLAGARLSLLRANDDQLLGSGIADARGEVLALAVGIPIIDFTTTPPPSPPPGGGGAPPPPAPVGTKKVAAKLIIETAPGQPWPTDPESITASGQQWVPVSGNLPTLELETGRIRADGLDLLLKRKP